MMFISQQLLPLIEERISEESFTLSSGKVRNKFIAAYANNANCVNGDFRASHLSKQPGSWSRL
jgi:hypothetical protein